MAKILRTSNRQNSRQDFLLNNDNNLKGVNKTGNETKASIMKDNRKRRHIGEGHKENQSEHEEEEKKENNAFSENGPIDDIDEPSEYELLRLRNIEQRRQMFQQLDIDKVIINSGDYLLRKRFDHELILLLNLNQNIYLVFQSKREATLAAGITTDNEGKYVPSKRGLAAQPKVKEFLPPRKSLRLQNISAETGLKLPDKEPTQYFTYDPSEVDNSRQPMRDLELEEFISQKDKSGDSETVSDYLTKINENLKMKDENSNANSFEDVPKRLKQLKITVSFHSSKSEISLGVKQM